MAPGYYSGGRGFHARLIGPLTRQPSSTLSISPRPRKQIAYSYNVKTDQAARLAKLHPPYARPLSVVQRKIAELLGIRERWVNWTPARSRTSQVAIFWRWRMARLMRKPIRTPLPAATIWQPEQSLRSDLHSELAIDGTREATPGLLEAIRQKRFRLAHVVGPLSSGMAGGPFDPPPRSVARRQHLAGRKHRQPGDIADRSRRGRGNWRHGWPGCCSPGTRSDRKHLDFRPQPIRRL